MAIDNMTMVMGATVLLGILVLYLSFNEDKSGNNKNIKNKKNYKEHKRKIKDSIGEYWLRKTKAVMIHQGWVYDKKNLLYISPDGHDELEIPDAVHLVMTQVQEKKEETRVNNLESYKSNKFETVNSPTPSSSPYQDKSEQELPDDLRPITNGIAKKDGSSTSGFTAPPAYNPDR